MKTIAQTVPPLEESKAIILKSKSAQWLKDAEVKFKKTYPSVKDPNLVMWMIGKHAGLSMAEIKQTGGAGEGTETTVLEMKEIVRKCTSKDLKGEKGWTLFKSTPDGLDVQQADNQAKYGIRICVLSKEEGTTRKGGPKLDLMVCDPTGTAKLVAYADAAKNLIEADCKPGKMYHLPLVNAQYGTHNFGKEKNAVWWKFSLPPFGEIKPIEGDVKEFFTDLDQGVPREDMPGYVLGFITHIEPFEQEVCTICDQWVMEKQPEKHAKCREEDNYDTEIRTYINGTVTSVNGQTYKLSFKVKPKIKVAEDLVEVYGRVTKKDGIDVAFVRKAGDASAEVEAAPKAKVAVVAKKPTKPAPPVEDSSQDEDPEDEAEQEEAEEAPAPKPKVTPKAVKKVVPPPPVEEEETPEEVVEAPEEEEEPMVVKAATKTTTAAKKPVVSIKPKQAEATQVTEEIELPDGMEEWIRTYLGQFGGKQRIFVLTRNAIGAEKMEASGDAETDKAQMASYCRVLVDQGTLEWTNSLQNEVRLAQ